MTGLKSALLNLPRQLTSPRGKRLDLETCRAGLEDIGSQLKLGKLTEAEADAARLALLSAATPSSRRPGNDRRGAAASLIVPVAVFFLITGMGAAATYLETGSETTGLVEMGAVDGAGPDDELIARLKDYAGSIGSQHASPETATGKLPDVDTMIERLAARLEAAPQDLDGWQMLGRSYLHTARYEQAAAAFAKAVELDPGSAELKSAFEEAKEKAAGGTGIETASTSPTGTGDASASAEAGPPPAQDAAIRSMVDGLADRLARSPNDVEGWTRLMRSRVVLGEKDVAATAFRKALEVFNGDAASSGKIIAAAIDLGLKTE